MSNTDKRSVRVQWHCLRCNTPLRILSGTRYYSCHTCGATFRLQWRGQQVESAELLDNISGVLKDSDTEQHKEQMVDNRAEVQKLNDRIRQMEMSKGGERLRVLAVFIIILAIIFLLFRMTVQGFSVLTEPALPELGAMGAAALALLIIIVFGLRKSAIVRSVNRLIEKRDKLEASIETSEAVLTLHRNAQEEEALAQAAPREDEKSPGEQQTTDLDDDGGDIIERFATRRRQNRNRLNIRDTEEEEDE